MQFIDLQAQRSRLGEPLKQAIESAVACGQWVLGPQVKLLEAELAKFAGVKHAIACANGTDALQLVLMAWGIGPGDAVFVPAFTFCATAEVVALVGATPVFVDVREDTFNIDSESLKSAIAMIRKQARLKPRAVIPVDLFGQPADYRAIEPIAREEKLKLLCDAAQSYGARLDNRVAGAIGDATATSFFPAKPLGCYGDGGASFTNDDELAGSLRSLHVHGEGESRYDNVRVGLNSRLDTIQAAILLEKLKIFEDEIAMRNRIAARYTEKLAVSNKIRVPHVMAGATSIWAQYTIRVPDRDRLQSDLKARGIPSMIYYPIPLSEQGGYKHFPRICVPVSQMLSKEVLALPMHPYLDTETQDRIVNSVLELVH